MARIENYVNDVVVTIDDKVIGTDAVDNSTKNFTVGDIVALANAGSTLTAGTGISITNGVISSTVVDTDTNQYISNVALNGTSLDFTGTAPAFNGSVSLGAIADQIVQLTGANGITIAGTYPIFTIDGAGITGTNTTYDLNSVVVNNDAYITLTGSDNTTDTITIHPGTNVSITSPGAGEITINATSGVTTLGSLTDATITSPSTGQYLVYNGTAWINADFKPAEKLILQIINGYTLGSGNSADLVFTAVTGNLNTGGLHTSPSNLADLGVAGAGFEVLNTDCKAKISLGAYIDAVSNNEVLTFTLTERDPNGITALKGNAQFDYARAGTHASAFFSNFELRAGYTYLFSASLTNTSNGVTILQPTQVEIEIIG